MIQVKRGFFILTLLFSAAGASASSVEAYWTNRQALRKFADKAYYPAYQEFLKALEEDPLNPYLHLNLARSFEANEEWEKAEQGYKSALKIIPENSGLRFEALFNLANVLVKEKRIEEALQTYQACLELQPDSKEVKTNIELLWQGGDGGGQGDKQNKDQQGQDKDKKDGQGQDKDQKKDRGQDPQQQQKKQPKPFESKELTPQDVRKILDEIKNQEQSIRAQEYERNAKEAPRGKDW